MRTYLTTTFSPAMLAPGASCTIHEVSLSDTIHTLNTLDAARIDVESAVGHEVTAQILGRLLGRCVVFNRQNLSVENSRILAIVPGFRTDSAREFTLAEIEAAPWRFFDIRVFPPR